MRSHTLIYFTIRAVNGIIGLGSIYILTRLLTADEYGSFALGIAGINVIASVLFQWLNVSIVRLFAENSQNKNYFFLQVRYLFLIIIGIGTLCLISWLIFRPTTSYSIEITAAIGISALAMGTYNMHLHIHNACQKPIQYGLLSASRAAIGLILAVFAVTAGTGVTGVLVSTGLGCIVATIIFGHRFQQNSKLSESGAKVRSRIINYGIPLALTYSATMVLDVSDRFLIGWWYGATAVSGYAASYDFAQQTIGVILNVFFLASFPRIAAEWESGGATAARLAMVQLTRPLLIVAPAAVGVFIGLAPDLAAVMFGPELRTEATHVMPWVASAIAIGCFKSYLLDIALQLQHRTGTQFRITLLMAGTNITLNLILLPIFGVLGSAISVTVAFLIGSILSFIAGKGASVVPPLKNDLLKSIFSMMIMILSFYWAENIINIAENPILELLIKTSTGLIIFIAAALLVNTSGIRKILFEKINP